MPQPITHLLVAQKAFFAQGLTWGDYSNFCGLGSIGPDMFYTKDILHNTSNERYGLVSDVLHWEASKTFFCAMLDYAKNDLRKDIAAQNKVKAFAYGYYSHVITDAVFHPFIYRITGDHWKLHDNKNNFLYHKKLESQIDFYLLRKYMDMDPFEFEYYKRIKCCLKDDESKLDPDLFKMFYFCLKDIYENLVDIELFRNELNESFFTLFEDYDSINNPIHDAYHDLTEAMMFLYNFEPLLNLISDERFKALLPIKSLNVNGIKEMEKINYINEKNNGNGYNFNRLFEIAIKATQNVIKISENYLKSDINESKVYFNDYSFVVYLDHDYNLDSGLPCIMNTSPLLLNSDRNICNNVYTDLLLLNYEKIEKLYESTSNI